jgi:hypothetical protein
MMPDAFVRSEKLPVLTRPSEEYVSVREAALRRIQDEACDCDVGPECHARKHVHAFRLTIADLEPPHTFIPLEYVATTHFRMR